MTRYLVVANQTLGGEELLAKVEEKMESEPASFHILVPAAPPREGATWTESEAERVARERLDMALERFRGLGAEVDGQVGEVDPLGAMSDVLRTHEFDEIILATLPAGISRWLRSDLPSRVARAFELPVTHVVCEPEEGAG